jgi:GTP-binding protein YchF
MDVAIIGLPQCGKTTIFNALTRGQANTRGGGEMHVGVVKVADHRVVVLGEMYQQEKLVYAEVKYWDIPGSDSPAKSQGISGKYRDVLQGADAFLLVVRSFTEPAVPHPFGSTDSGRDLANMMAELALTDLEVLERAEERLDDRIKKSKAAERPALVSQLETVKKVKHALDEGAPLRQQELTGSETAIIASYQLLTSKPVIAVLNTDEAGPEVSLDAMEDAGEWAGKLGQVSLCGKLEADLALMSDEEAEEFRSELGLGEPAVSRVVRASYDALGLVSFLTVGDDEIRAWSVPAGMAAQRAAGTIHTDFERGFIRAEVISFDDLVRCGSISKGRKEGVLRSEGKTYGIKDGDVIDFLINV